MAEYKTNSLTTDQENRLYISEKINPFLEKMIFSLLKEKPWNSVSFQYIFT